MTAPAFFFAPPSQVSTELRADAMLPAENSAVTQEAADSLVGEFSREQIALDEGVDYFSAQGALAAYRLGRVA